MGTNFYAKHIPSEAEYDEMQKALNGIRWTYFKSMTLQEFKNQVLQESEGLPNNWRKGQRVFNYIDAYYGVARKIQFEDGIDCFYKDEYIDEFLNKAYEYLPIEDN